MHEGVSFSKQEVLGFIRGYVQELSLHNTNSNAVIGFAVNECWRPPDDGLIKINFDAAFSQDTGLATIAVLARDYKGEVVGGETYLVLNVADSFMAEARACERALVFAHKMGFRRLEVEGDALQFRALESE